MATVKEPQIEPSEEFALPEDLAVCVDLMYQTKQERIKMQHVIDVLAKRESTLREHIINTLPKSNATGIAGKLARATIVTKVEPAVEDWDIFFAYVAKTKAWDMLQRRISAPAIRARWEDKKAVAGVGKINIVSVSLNKV